MNQCFTPVKYINPLHSSTVKEEDSIPVVYGVQQVNGGHVLASRSELTWQKDSVA